MVTKIARAESATTTELTPAHLQLYEANIHLVRWAARHVHTTSALVRRRLSLEDCRGHAAIAAASACQGFDSSLGTNFSTYMVRCITNGLKEAAYNATLVHVPRNQQRAIIKNRPHAYAPDALRAMGRHGPLDGFDLIARAEDEDDDGEQHSDLRGALGKLNGRERQVIIGRFWEGKTLEQVGGELGVTKCQARQIQVNAIKQLRASLPPR